MAGERRYFSNVMENKGFHANRQDWNCCNKGAEEPQLRNVSETGKQGKERKGEKGDEARNAGELQKLHSSRQNKR